MQSNTIKVIFFSCKLALSLVSFFSVEASEVDKQGNHVLCNFSSDRLFALMLNNEELCMIFLTGMLPCVQGHSS